MQTQDVVGDYILIMLLILNHVLLDSISVLVIREILEMIVIIVTE